MKGSMREILVIRFGALGDLCVLGWALARLRAESAPDSSRVTLVTKAAFAPLMGRMQGIDEVMALEDSSLTAVADLAARLRRRRWDTVIDAHNTLRSHLLTGLMGRRPAARLAKDTAARLAFMALGRPHAHLSLHMRDRFDDLFAALRDIGQSAASCPPLAHLRPGAAPVPILGLAPGAQWDTKRWPEENFAALLALYRCQSNGPVRVYLGPRERAWYAGSALARAMADTEGADVFEAADLTEVAVSLAGLSLLVTNDSGLLHLAEAVNTPVLALFGPTVQEFGYFPLLAASGVLEQELSCRPCSRNGKRPCHRGDLACLRRITPPDVLAALGPIGTGGGSP
jgi:heptosyltransferase-2